ncbi:MAG: glycosyltransferase family 2 protein [Bacteroidota bacterium]|nr:glycosyltransferase family 2 protein [Bacteroidota bacterium]
MKVGIVIPCRNEEKYIGKCLDSIVKQTAVGNEILVYVCDGKSDDHTEEIVKKYSEKHPSITLIINENRTTPFALNLGIKKALKEGCDLVIILGAHAELYSDYVEKCVRLIMEKQDVSCVGGVLENEYENNISETIGLAMSSPFGVGNAHFRTGARDGYVDTVAFGAYKKEVFGQIGFFDEELVRNQDDEFNFRLLKSGGKIFLSKQIRCKYFVRASFKKLFKQYMQYGYWKVYVGKKHKSITTIRQLIPLLFVLYLFFGAVMSLAIPKFWILYVAGLLVYKLAAVYFASKVLRTSGQLFSILQVFVTLHFSYGLGYLRGIVDFLVVGKNIKKEEEITR